MKTQVNSQAIILSRTDFGEADRILTVLTPDHGKRRLMAKGVRKIKSKLAGGIELFSVSQVSFIPGRSEIDTLVSTRLVQHFGHIVGEVQRTMLGYDLLKRLNKATEDATGPEYFELLQNTLAALDKVELSHGLIELWFNARLLKLGGHQPNLHQDVQGDNLQADEKYSFNIDSMAFAKNQSGEFMARQIKFLRLLFNTGQPLPLQKIQDIQALTKLCQPLVWTMLRVHSRL